MDYDVLLDTSEDVVIADLVCFKQKTAYDMRISDGSSDVCSSDLADGARANDGTLLYWERRQNQYVYGVAIVGNGLRNIAVVARVVHGRQHEAVDEDGARVFIDFVLDRIGIHGDFDDEIGSASCRERVWQYV